MKFLVDAHLPRKLAIQLKEAGYDTRHTLGLPQANRTTDQFINEISLAEHYSCLDRGKHMSGNILTIKVGTGIQSSLALAQQMMERLMEWLAIERDSQGKVFTPYAEIVVDVHLPPQCAA